MHLLLIISGLLADAVGALILSNAQSAIHEIEAFLLFLIGAVLFGTGCIVDAIKTGFAKAKAST